MSDEFLVKVEGVSKKFCRRLKRSLWYGVRDIGTELIGRAKKPELRKGEFWAVNDVSFELRRGECLGLIGHNGAGKSTLLKMLNGLIKPDKGRITMQGRIGALIELGTGFNPILTGRENIYNNGAVLGFTKREIDQKFDSIVGFSEMEDFIDTPVQNYSSGMKVRLGFAVAAHMDPDVLLVDEVLAVGDISFTLKCFNRMDELLRNTSIILVSHNIPMIDRMSTHLILMNEGKVVFNRPDVSEGINLYYSMLDKQYGNYLGSDIAILEEVTLRSGGRSSEDSNDFYVNYGEELTVKVKIKLNREITKPNIYLAFFDRAQRNFGEVLNFKDEVRSIRNDNVYCAFETYFPSIEFAQGIYSVTVGMSDLSDDVTRMIFRKQSAAYFTVRGKHHGWAPMQFHPRWRQVE
ncbi:MAG: ATP-binding cassette domain-containing protein [Lentimicrobiaceae bacterium]|nr:ATP-binding cassette domain-containing protein [Lentimicrobiaceae bacterium]